MVAGSIVGFTLLIPGVVLLLLGFLFKHAAFRKTNGYEDPLVTLFGGCSSIIAAIVSWMIGGTMSIAGVLTLVVTLAIVHHF